MANFYKTVFFDNYDTESILSKDDFLEMLRETYTEDEINEMTYDMKYELYMDDVYRISEYTFEDVLKEIGKLLNGKVFLASGDMERWNGTNTGIELMGYNSYFNSYEDFEEFFNNFSKDCEYFKMGITRDNKIFIQCSHHDGTNYIELKIVTPKGISLLHKFFYDGKLQQYSDIELLGKIWNSKIYSEKLPKDYCLGM